MMANTCHGNVTTVLDDPRPAPDEPGIIEFMAQSEGFFPDDAAGLGMARVALGGGGSVDLLPPDADPALTAWPGCPWPTIRVTSNEAVAACLAAQYAGWKVSAGGYFAMAYGPMGRQMGGPVQDPGDACPTVGFGGLGEATLDLLRVQRVVGEGRGHLFFVGPMVEVGETLAPVGIGDDEKAPVLGITPRRGLQRDVHALPDHLEGDRAFEIETLAHRAGRARDGLEIGDGERGVRCERHQMLRSRPSQ